MKTSNRFLAAQAGMLLVSAFAGTAGAANLDFEPYAAGLYQYESNVYKFSRQVADVTGTSGTSDHVQKYTAGLDAGYTWRDQKIHGRAEGRRFTFGEFSHLDHDEHFLEAGLSGVFLGSAKGLMIFSNERRMASFEDRRSTDLTIERENLARGELDVAVMPQWHVVTGARYRNIDSPLPDAPALPFPPPGAAARLASPDFAAREMAYKLGVQYGIEAKDHPEDEIPLLIGLMLEHQAISFSGVTPQPDPPPGVTRETFEGYSLLSLQTTILYVVSELSKLDGKLGASRYMPEESSGESRLDLTGEIGYTRSVTAVTEINGHLFRRIAPYAATADSTADVGASIGIKWQPRLDLLVLANYSWSRSSFRGLSGIAQENDGRGDKAQSATLSLYYPMFQYFGIRLFSSYSDRRSSLEFNDYTDEIFGAELSARWK